MANEFDVFLSHNSQDKPRVEEIAARLQAQGVTVWLDKHELRPGLPWHQGLQDGIRASKSVAVFIGGHDLGGWQGPEMWAFTDRSRRENLPVIPVLLPDCPASPELDLFLQAFTWVDLRGGITDEGIASLVWGITGKKPERAAPVRPPTPPVIPAPGLGSHPPSPAPSAKEPRPRWEVWGIGVGIATVLVALGAWLWPDPIQKKLLDLYSVRVQILDPTGRPVAGARVKVSHGNEPQGLPDGWWEVEIPGVKLPQDGKITIWAEHGDWEQNEAALVLAQDPNPSARIQLKPPQSVLRGLVVDETNRALAGVTITLQDGTPGIATSDAHGAFALTLPIPPERKIGLRAELKGWSPDATQCYTARDGCQMVLTKP